MHSGTYVAALHHISYIHLTAQDAVNGGIGPIGGAVKAMAVGVLQTHQLFVDTGTGDILVVQYLGDTDLTYSLRSHRKDALDHL